MVLERVKQLAQQVSNTVAPPHPFDPLSALEIETAVSILRAEHGKLFYNAVTLQEPPKKEMLAWLADPSHSPRPKRVADIVVITTDGKVYDGLVDLGERKVLQWAHTPDVQPLVTMEDLNAVEAVCRKDSKVIEQCGLIGIPPEDMHKVYCDPWTIGYDERFGNAIRLQQALMYYRPHVDDSQYSYPLDFCPIYDANKGEIIHIDVPKVRRPVNKAPPNNYTVQSINDIGGYRTDLKPINITQPEGVSFKVNGRVIEWQNWSVHVGFNYKEGIVLNNISYFDKVESKLRPIFYRLSLAEMVVPYGNPEHPHHRKHAFDLGEYGGGYMTNSLALGCDCKGSIHYMDADFVNKAGAAQKIKNAICIHEEDAGILFKHTDFRDDSVIVTRARKLIISHTFTPANYEYCVYWIFHQDGTVQLEIKLTGILSTYSMNPGEDPLGWGTEVYPGVNAHNHQHLFCMRIDPNIDGPSNTIFQVDAARGEGEVGSPQNYYGNAFYAKKKKLSNPVEAMCDYDGSISRTWEMCNENKLNPYSHKPVSYKLVSREVPSLLPKDNSLVWKRAGFARHAVHVTKCTFPSPPSLHPTNTHRLRLPAPPRRPPRPPNLRRAIPRPPTMDPIQPDRKPRERRRRPLAHLWHHTFPVSRGLPCHACGADDGVVEAEEFLCQEPLS
jgi:primary-amine oxidase